jgi:hypothetical protein
VNQRHFNALLAVELKRARPVLVRLGIATPLGLGVFLLLGKGTPQNLLAVVLGAGLGVAVAGVPSGVLRDKLDGTLEFFLRLPATPGTVVAARFAAAALASLPWALATAAVFALVARSYSIAGNPVAAAWGMLAVSWCALSALSWVAMAVWARFEPRRAGMWPLGLIVIVGVLGSISGRLLRALGVDDLSAVVSAALNAPWLPLAAALSGAALVAGVSLAAFHVTRCAFRDYRSAGGSDG